MNQLDGYTQVIKNGGCCAMSMACLCGLICCGGAITFISFLGKYAFANPDAEAWYGTVGGQEDLFPTQAAGDLLKAGDMTDIHGKFVTWFLWGFIQALLPCGTGILSAICGLIHPSAAACMSGLGGLGIGCGGLAWWITGMVWRFGAAGKFAAGDVIPEGVTEEQWQTYVTAEGSLVQYSSGNFMAIYYLLTWIFMGTACGCSILGALISCCKR